MLSTKPKGKKMFKKAKLEVRLWKWDTKENMKAIRQLLKDNWNITKINTELGPMEITLEKKNDWF